jgi:hypothetical protein
MIIRDFEYLQQVLSPDVTYRSSPFCTHKPLQFIQRIKSSHPDNLTEIPRAQRFAERPPLSDLTSGLATAGKTVRNKAMHEAHVRYGYTLKEIADRLGIHYGTVSRIVTKMSETRV